MNIQDLCEHTYSRWTGKEVLCAVCAKHMGIRFPPVGSPAHQAMTGVFDSQKYGQWLWNNKQYGVATTMTIGRVNDKTGIPSL